MKQLTFIKKNTLEWWDIKEPKLETAQDVIVRSLAAARCDGDKAFLEPTTKVVIHRPSLFTTQTNL